MEGHQEISPSLAPLISLIYSETFTIAKNNHDQCTDAGFYLLRVSGFAFCGLAFMQEKIATS
jgi:hypothetical protein